MVIKERCAFIAKIDYDEQDPYLLAKKLLALGSMPMYIRTSATKGVHIKLFTVSKESVTMLRYMLDDPFRVVYDESREKRNLSRQFSNILWDWKNGNIAGMWFETIADDFANWLLQSGYRTVRSAVENLPLVLEPVKW